MDLWHYQDNEEAITNTIDWWTTDYFVIQYSSSCFRITSLFELVIIHSCCCHLIIVYITNSITNFAINSNTSSITAVNIVVIGIAKGYITINCITKDSFLALLLNTFFISLHSSHSFSYYSLEYLHYYLDSLANYTNLFS